MASADGQQAVADEQQDLGVDVDPDDVTQSGGDPETASDATSAAGVEVASAGGSRTVGDWLAGAGGVVSAGLGLSSLIGTPVGDMLRTHTQITGQIQSQLGGGQADQVQMLYADPWHAEAMSNGIIAVIALVLGGVLLAVGLRPESRTWVRALALGGVVLGALGAVMAAGMYFDFFAAPPQLPKQPGPPGLGG